MNVIFCLQRNNIALVCRYKKPRENICVVEWGLSDMYAVVDVEGKINCGSRILKVGGALTMAAGTVKE
jgi:hypothetical protein